MERGRFLLWFLRRLFNCLMLIVCLQIGVYVSVLTYRWGTSLLPIRRSAPPTRHPQALSGRNFNQLSLEDAVISRFKGQNISERARSYNSFSRRKGWICARKFGRQGNQMFQAAALMSIANQKGMWAFVEADSALVTLFELPGMFIKPSGKSCEGLKVHHERNSSKFDMSWTEFDSNADVAIAGYFQSWRYFHNISDFIRRQFTLRPTTRALALDALAKSMATHRKSIDVTNISTFVALHVRRNDMMNPERKRLGNNVAPVSFITNAMNYFRRRFRDVVFIAGSDDMDWVKSNIPSFDTLYLEGNSGAVDFAVLSMCEHTIVTVGTFGWWVAWLVNGTTVYYKHQFNNNSNVTLRHTMNMNDYLYPNWIPME